MLLRHPAAAPAYAVCYDPFTATLAVIGTGLSALGQIQQGKAANAMAKYNAKVAERDAEAARRASAIEGRGATLPQIRAQGYDPSAGTF